MWARAIGVLSLAMMFAPTQASALALEDLDGVSIEATVAYNMHVRRAEGEFRPQLTSIFKFKISDQGRIVGENVRTVTTKAGPQSRSYPINGRIGKPGEPAVGGHALWLIDGDKLILLRALDAGGFKAEIAFKGSGKAMKCSFRAPYVREEGAGDVRTEGVVPGKVTVLSAKEKSADCKVSR